MKIAGAKDAAADIEYDVGFIEAQYPMRCMEGPTGEAAPALQREPAGHDEEDAADRRCCDLRGHIAHEASPETERCSESGKRRSSCKEQKTI